MIFSKCLIILASLLGALSSAHFRCSAQNVQGIRQLPLRPVVDVVAVHRMSPDDNRPEQIENPFKRGYLQAVNVNVKSLIKIAYDMPDLRMLGGPAWLTSERFFLEAKADPRVDEQLTALPTEQAKAVKREMVAALLKERFQLAVHEETRQLPVYAMTVVKVDLRSGDGKPASVAESRGNELIEIRERSGALQILAYELSWRLGRPVLNRTGIEDTRSLTLRWRDDNAAATDSDAPSVFTAIREQLGLKLESTRATVPVLVIDHAEQPVGQ